MTLTDLNYFMRVGERQQTDTNLSKLERQLSTMAMKGYGNRNLYVDIYF